MGCLKAIFVRAGCAVLLVAAIVAGAIYHRQILDYIDAFRGKPTAYQSPAATGRTPAATALERLRQPSGPAFEDLTAPELAALISSSLSPGPHPVFDSVQVALLDNEVRVRGSLDLRSVPRSMLGPFASALGDREPVAIGGPLAVDSLGRLVLTVTYLTVKDFPFPRGTIPRLLQALRIPHAQESSVPLPLPMRLGDVRVTPEHVRFYRAAPL